MSTMILWGIVAVFIAALLGGVTGFGFNLVATPLLLLLGVAPATAVAINLAIALLTRVSVMVRLRRFIRWRRALPLTAASVPGLFAGAVIGGAIDEGALRVVAGVVVLVVSPILMLRRRVGGGRIRSRYALSGFTGGALATTTSLNGVPVALTLAADEADQRSFLADLAVYFVLSNVVALSVLALRDGVSGTHLLLLAWWLPGALLANWVGTALGQRIAPERFRVITCCLAMAAGVLTLVSV